MYNNYMFNCGLLIGDTKYSIPTVRIDVCTYNN